MLKSVGSRLTYANVMATGAMFLALGGGAYALSGIPDRAGVYHGCVDPKAGALRVVKGASACRKTKTVRRGTRRVRIPGESAIAWNQQGLRGVQGLQGLRGLQGNTGLKGDKGDQGPAGPTQGFAQAQASAAVPSSTPDSAGAMQSTVPTPASGKLFVFARGTLQPDCTHGSGTFVQLGIYVDGAAVPATGRVVSSGALTEVSMFGLTGTLSAGSHLVEVAGDCNPGDSSGGITVTGDAATGAIFVGS